MKVKKWLNEVSEIVQNVNKISEEYYNKYDIKQGLRNSNGTGVVVGFTKVGSVQGYKYIDGQKIPVEGKLFYRDIEIEDLVKDLSDCGFEDTMYLLLLGKLPSENEKNNFNSD